MDADAVKLRQMGPNAHVVVVGDLELAFSYETCVGYRRTGERPTVGWVASENLWGPTTGKHIVLMTQVRPHGRLPREEFLRALALQTAMVTR